MGSSGSDASCDAICSAICGGISTDLWYASVPRSTAGGVVPPLRLRGEQDVKIRKRCKWIAVLVCYVACRIGVAEPDNAVRCRYGAIKVQCQRRCAAARYGLDRYGISARCHGKAVGSLFPEVTTSESVSAMANDDEALADTGRGAMSCTVTVNVSESVRLPSVT